MLRNSMWQMVETNEDAVAHLMSETKIPYNLACLLVHRGIDTKEAYEAYFHVSREKFHDPFLMPDMNVAVKRILAAREREEQIYIYGDYDVDGVTSTSILFMFLDEIGCKVNYYIPDRHEEGYGINSEAVGKLYNELGAKLMISVDTGITAVDQVDHANELGLDVIITDHHECQESLPRALAVINPKRPDSKYPFDMLAGVGVTFKLIHGIAEKTGVVDLIWKYLDIVAVGTVADIVPLHGENRIITKLAFETMPTTWNIGLKALMKVADLDGKKMTAGRIGFGIGPRLNAAGRILHAKQAVELFISHDEDKCYSIAEDLDAVNKERQDLEKKIFEEAVDIIETTMDPSGQHVIVIAHEGWHHGVIGIVASKLVERYYRPVVILAIEEGIASGSARSVEGFSIFEALYATKDVFNKFGGHDMAAGMSLDATRVDELRENLNQFAKETMAEDVLIPKVKVDMKLEVNEVNIPFIEQLQEMEPFGVGNREPSFRVASKVTEVKRIGKDLSHLRVGFDRLKAIGFSMGDADKWLQENDTANVVCSLEINEWRDQRNPQLMLKDIRLEDKVYASIKETVDEVRTGELDDIITAETFFREEFTSVYRFLQYQSKVKDTTVYYTKWMKHHHLKSVKELAKYLVILKVFEELGLVTVKYEDFFYVFELTLGKKVALEDSSLYNKLSAQ